MEVDSSQTFGAFKTLLLEKMEGAPGIEVKVGFPPRSLEGDAQTLAELGIKNGDRLLVEECEGGVASGATEKKQKMSSLANPIVRRVVDADNSCLFNCFGYCLMKSRHESMSIRQIVQKQIRENPLLYGEAFLGKSNADYASWIGLKDAWGGQIEIAILAEHFNVCVQSFDIQTVRVDTYNETAKRRIMIIYDGIHYDPLAMGLLDDESKDVTVFEPEMYDSAVASATALTEQQHKAHAFTDTSKFSLRCLVCGKGLAGEQDAMKHAQETAPQHHTNFAEYKK